jgi:peptidoglycan/xylan/chitin deacetylase (PgdA/CDA1 family)
MQRRLVVLALVAGCRADDRLSYTWDDRRVLCSQAVDDLSQTLDWSHVADQIALAERESWVTMMHAHQPRITISPDTIERVLQTADDHHLDYVTFSELVPGAPHPGLALAFDDDDVEGWFLMRDTFNAHHARLTFFVTRWYELTKIPDADGTPSELDMLAMLAADGHDLQPHSVNHLDASEYVHAHGIDSYLADEVLPSIQVMADAGYHPTSFAYPFGATTDPINDAVLQHIDRVRTTPAPCPY